MYSIIRDRTRVWPYCLECNCRLSISVHTIQLSDGSWDSDDELNSLSHYGKLFSWVDVDGRGHKCSKINDTWEISKNKLFHLYR